MQSHGIDASTAHQQALALLNQTLDSQAMLLAFADLFRVVGLIFLVTLPLLLLLGRGKKQLSPVAIKDPDNIDFGVWLLYLIDLHTAIGRGDRPHGLRI